jgi:hypothetical protein
MIGPVVVELRVVVGLKVGENDVADIFWRRD